MSGTGIDPCDIVVFGGTGDLAMRKLLPALYHQFANGTLPPGTRVIACSRAGVDDEGYRAKVQGELPGFLPEGDVDDATLAAFVSRLQHVCLDIAEGADWTELVARLDDADRVRVYYLACAAALFGPVATTLAAHDLITDQSRVVLEKPIGRDLASSRAINDAVGAVFDETQIFRIDHYLGKESVQNLLVTRFANTILEPVWNNRAIDHVQITVAESLGVGQRGGYYDGSGALRDMVQNHLLQLLCLVAMEPPNVVGRENLRDEKLKVLRALKPITAEDAAQVTVSGQYTAGLVAGSAVGSYVEDSDCPASRTETFAALRVEIENWRWAGVPFYLRTGKRMPERYSEIVIQFKPVPHPMFPHADGTAEPNRLVIGLQPDEGMTLQMTAKEPGPGGIRLRPVNLALDYASACRNGTPEAYERLRMDVVRGNPTLFMRRDEVEAAWTWAEPILAAWDAADRRPQPYPAGTAGPHAATSLLERDGRSWHQRDNR
jgi:glucose-6-phosphate 1-dehydrogenase